MDLSIKVGDKIKLNFDVKEFHIIKCFEGSKSYSFKNIQLNILKFANDFKLKIDDFLPCFAPIILSDYEEQLVKISIEDNRQIGYTKSFRIDLLKAIEEEEIKVNFPTIDNIKTQRNNQLFENFVNDLIEFNVSFAVGLITKSERKQHLIGAFENFYRVIFKEEIQQREIEDKKLTDEEFFTIRWNGRPDKINGITFIGPVSIPLSSNSWVNQFKLEGIKRGIDKKTSFGFYFSGIHISKKRNGDFNKCEANLIIQISQKNYPNPSTNINELIFDVEFSEKNKEKRIIEIKNLWQNKEFLGYLNRVIESQTW